jgi:hypothetical protein
MKNKTTNKSGPTAYDKLIEPKIKASEKIRGFGPEVARQLSKQWCRTVSRQQVNQWMNPDRELRVQPNYSTTLDLIVAIDRALIVLAQSEVV